MGADIFVWFWGGWFERVWGAGGERVLVWFWMGGGGVCFGEVGEVVRVEGLEMGRG